MSKPLEGEYIAKGEYDPTLADLQGGAMTKEQMERAKIAQSYGMRAMTREEQSAAFIRGSHDPFGDNPYNSNPQSGQYRRINTFT